MHITTLSFFCQRLALEDIIIDQITIKGKHSNRISFMATFKDTQRIQTLCCQLKYNAWRTTDTFIDTEVFVRWQVDLV